MTYGQLEALLKENQQLLETSKAYKKLLKTTMQKEHNAMKVLDEIREYINKNSIYFATKEKVGNYFANCSCDELLQILDKVDYL